jgi:asparagine synthase (glutamine-hydrolysing)
MATVLQHRGPDDDGMWVNAGLGVGLGHRRLSIIDLSQAGHQPMCSATQRFVLSYNGEIYNHSELRQLLDAEGASPAWRGHSDTETLLAAFEHWGIDDTLRRLVGMFAIALWDTVDHALYLVRDRFGEKPLYYGWTNDAAFVFGSELKALRAFRGFGNDVCREALAQYMRFMYVPAPRSIYRGVFKLEPGCYLRLEGRPPSAAPRQPVRPGESHESLSMRRWWSLAKTVEDGASNQILDENEALHELEERLSTAVRLQSIADVPLGAFLSGGVDSSTIVSLMQAQSRTKVNTFTIGFDNPAFDESPYARAVARHLGTMHTELFVTSAETREIVPRLPAIYDEPFADSSQIPTHMVCRVARQHVTVAMSGDAGDELFGGYNRYLWGPRMWRSLAWMPYSVRRVVGSAIDTIPAKGWDALGNTINRVLPARHGVSNPSDKVQKLATRLRSVQDMRDIYLSLVSEWQDPTLVVRGLDGPVREPASLLADPPPATGVADARALMMYHDALTYLPDDILCKLDRASMATALETRVPFLDHRVVELAWRLPLNMKIRDGEGKWALRQLLYRHVPRKLIERPKVGFGVPLGEWLRGSLKHWAEDLLDASRLRREGYFDADLIRRRWSEHQAGRYDHTHSIWSVLMFQAWLESNT